MAENSKIEWCDHTFNPWIGCAKISTGCEMCYAEASQAKRYKRVVWGPAGTRMRTSDANWRLPLRWNRVAERDGTRPKVFCASLADVFDDWGGSLFEYGCLDVWRNDLWNLIGDTPNLQWLLLTKRPENVLRFVPESWRGGFPERVGVGVSIENAECLSRLMPLSYIHCRVKFISAEPLLAPIDFAPWLRMNSRTCPQVIEDFRRHAWVIVGGESGPDARPCNVAWIESIIEQCAAAGVPCFVKQLGSNPVQTMVCDDGQAAFGQDVRIDLRDRKGGDPAEWPEGLRVREFPAEWRTSNSHTRRVAAEFEG